MKLVALVVSAWLAIAVTGLVLATAPDARATAHLFKVGPDRVDVPEKLDRAIYIE